MRKDSIAEEIVRSLLRHRCLEGLSVQALQNWLKDLIPSFTPVIFYFLIFHLSVDCIHPFDCQEGQWDPGMH